MPLSDSQLGTKIQATLEPLYAAHMSRPTRTKLTVTVDTDEVFGSLALASVDFNGLDSAMKSSFTRTFNTLVRSLDSDSSRVATGLVYVDGG